MFLENLIEESTDKYKDPSMLLVLPPPIFRREIHLPNGALDVVNFPEEEILKTFSKNPNTDTIVICGHEPMTDTAEIRSFIFCARKFFPPTLRPLIIIYTNYFYDELPKRALWSGLYCEILQYGRVILKCGRPRSIRESFQFNNVLGRNLSKSESIVMFNGYQYS